MQSFFLAEANKSDVHCFKQWQPTIRPAPHESNFSVAIRQHRDLESRTSGRRPL
jgi:hypothetical protein